MEKKDLKMYVSPAIEAVEVELEGHLLDASIVQPEFARETEIFDDEEK